jgi:hypothetical protein
MKVIDLFARVLFVKMDTHDERIASHRLLLAGPPQVLVCNDIRRQIYNLGFDHRRQALVQRREPDERPLVHFDVRYFVRIYPCFDNELVVAVANRNMDASVIFTCRLSD